MQPAKDAAISMPAAQSSTSLFMEAAIFYAGFGLRFLRRKTGSILSAQMLLLVLRE